MDIGLSKDQTRKVAERLNVLLSDEYLLFTKLLNYHWNVTGPFFGPLHMLFENQYNAIFKTIDAVAERSRMLGQISFGTLAEFLDHAAIKEKAGDVPPAETMIKNLVDDHETIIRQLRVNITEVETLGDMGTVDFLSGILEQHEKMAWFLRSHLA
jgi:starvation-inducible DNA-binding protein